LFAKINKTAKMELTSMNSPYRLRYTDNEIKSIQESIKQYGYLVLGSVVDLKANEYCGILNFECYYGVEVPEELRHLHTWSKIKPEDYYLMVPDLNAITSFNSFYVVRNTSCSNKQQCQCFEKGNEALKNHKRPKENGDSIIVLLPLKVVVPKTTKIPAIFQEEGFLGATV
jgi:hypothetical protein